MAEEDVKYVTIDSSPKGYCHQRIHISRELIEESMKKEEEPKMETCTCKWDGKTLLLNPDCPLHKRVGGLVSKEGVAVLSAGEPVIPIESMKEGVPPIELRIHGDFNDPKLRDAIEKAVKKAMERASRCTCKPVSMEKDELDPNCSIHGEKQDE